MIHVKQKELLKFDPTQKTSYLSELIPMQNENPNLLVKNPRPKLGRRKGKPQENLTKTPNMNLHDRKI